MESVFDSQDRNRLVAVFYNLEALLDKEVQALLNTVLGSETDVGTTAVEAATNQRVVILEFGITEACHRVQGESVARGDNVVDVEIEVVGRETVVLEIVDELGSKAQVFDGLILELCTETCHGVLGSVVELCSNREVTLLSASAQNSHDSHEGKKYGFFHHFVVL